MLKMSNKALLLLLWLLLYMLCDRGIQSQLSA